MRRTIRRRASAFLPPGTPPVFTNYFSDWQTGFNLSWELDVWGRFRRNIESANAELDASVEDYDAVLVTLLADVATNYTRLRVAQQRINIARANVHIQEDVLTLAEEKFRVGTATKLDVEQAKTVLEQTRSLIPAFEIEQGQANDMLCTLLGMPPRDLAVGAGTRAGTERHADAEDAGLGRGGNSGRPVAAAAGRAERRAADRGAECPDRRGRGGPVSELLHQWHDRLRSAGPFRPVRVAELHGERGAELSLEHFELRADSQQRAARSRRGRWS